MTSSREEQEEEKVIIRWQTTSKPTVYDLETFNQLKKKPTGTQAGTGHLVFNPITNQHEKPASIEFLPPSKKRKGN